MYVKNSYLHNFTIHTGIRVQSLTKGQIIMDVDLRWGGDPSIILAVEAALVASIPIQVCLAECFLLNTNITIPFFILSKFDFYCFCLLQLKDLKVFTIARVIFQLAEEIPCISAVVVALLAEVIFQGC